MMIFTEKQFTESKFKDLLPMRCDICNKDFFRTKKEIYSFKKKGYIKNCCCLKCQKQSLENKVPLHCENCGKSIEVKTGEINKRNRTTKSNKFFCSRSCSTSYYNTHKIKGIRRSKLELFLENKIKEEFPNLILLPNDVTTINCEIDLYLPSLNFGIEINGIVHYEPIYGITKLERTQYTDKQKILLCAEKGIELCIVPNIYDRLTDNIKENIWNSIKTIILNIISRKL